MSALESHFWMILRSMGLHETFVQEYRFAPPRRFRFDFADVANRIAVECEGGAWNRGRHVRGAGFAKDAEKYNLATSLGWRVLRYTSKRDMTRFPEDYDRLTGEDSMAVAFAAAGKVEK